MFFRFRKTGTVGIKKIENNSRGIFKVSKKFKFLRAERPWTSDMNVDELPPEGSELDYRMDSKRTYTKWFNPMTFDARAPEYYETVRGEWQEDVTQEDWGSSMC